jgi:hypothetical protein
MFAPFCYRHGSRVLLPTTAITALIPTDCGLVAHFTCTCGETGIRRPNSGQSGLRETVLTRNRDRLRAGR